MAVGTLEEIIDDNHAIVSTSVGSEYYVNMLSFVDKDLIEPGCTVLLNNKVNFVGAGSRMSYLNIQIVVCVVPLILHAILELYFVCLKSFGL